MLQPARVLKIICLNWHLVECFTDIGYKLGLIIFFSDINKITNFKLILKFHNIMVSRYIYYIDKSCQHIIME